MFTIFFLCALIGGGILLLQVVTAAIGLGDHGFDLDVGLPDPSDVADVDWTAGHDFSDTHLDSSWMFGIISFRTMVAATAFFGITGILAQSAGLGAALQAVVAVAGGLGAMFIVHWIMQSMKKLSQDGTVRIQNAVGQTATVYIPIPAKQASAGKVQVKIQGRLMEYEATTKGPVKLQTGSTVVVVDVVGPHTLEVVPAKETKEVMTTSARSV